MRFVLHFDVENAREMKKKKKNRIIPKTSNKKRKSLRI